MRRRDFLAAAPVAVAASTVGVVTVEFSEV